MLASNTIKGLRPLNALNFRQLIGNHRYTTNYMFSMFEELFSAEPAAGRNCKSPGKHRLGRCLSLQFLEKCYGCQLQLRTLFILQGINKFLDSKVASR